MMRMSINTPLVASTVFIVVAAIAALVQLPTLMEALVTPRPGADPTQARLGEYLEGHTEDLSTYQERFEGRSLFVKPAPPRQVVPPRLVAPVKDNTPEPPKPPPVPREYEGPSVNFVLGDEVWFHDGVRVRVGEKGSNGVTVVATNPPWSVTLEHGGGKYDIVLFERTFEGLDEKPRARGPLPGLVRVETEDTAPTPTPTATPTRRPSGRPIERQGP